MMSLIFWRPRNAGRNIPESKTQNQKSNSKDAKINISQLSNGESAEVVELYHNNKIIRKLEAMGIVPGVVITKKSSIFAKGPVIVEKGSVQFAVGYDTAQKIIVRPLDLGGYQ
ncbi:MAG: FeoA family protein [Bacillota bacterium]|nr:FeoA family protein [Bacillota bacterium]